MRNRYLLLCDVPIVAMAAYGAFALRFDWYVPRTRQEFLPYLIVALLLKPIAFFGLGMYSRIWRYASVRDLLAVLTAVSVASFGMSVFVAGGVLSGVLGEFSRAVVFIDWLLTLCAIGGLRMAVRLAAENRYGTDVADGEPRRVLVVGAGDAGTMVVREMRRNPQLLMSPVAFLDDDRSKLGKRVHGVPVIGRTAFLASAIEQHQIAEVIIAMPKVAGHVVRALSEACRAADTPSRIVPGVFELLDGQLTVSRLRQVDISDLLRREQIATRPETSLYLTQKRVVVTGAGGSIGHELSRQIALANPSLLLLLGHGENSIFEAQSRLRDQFPGLDIQAFIADVRDSGRLRACFERVRPQIVFHAAAHKHVPLMEDNPEEAITNNVVGTSNVVEACIANGVERLVMISTDKAVAPASVMGASKRLAEIVVRHGARRSGRAFSVVRFGNVLGSRGSVVPIFNRQIERGGPITITHPDVKRFFMTIPEAVHLVLQAGGLSKGGELFVLDMGAPVRIVQLAEDLIRLSGLNTTDIPIAFTGLRPGEKMEEALWETGAVVEPTAHPEVLLVKEEDDLDAAEMLRSLGDLVSAARAGTRLHFEAALAQWLPTYVPSSVPKHLVSEPH
jgi:FlaA1/EpsC-like NDP-sugar epimerase